MERFRRQAQRELRGRPVGARSGPRRSPGGVPVSLGEPLDRGGRGRHRGRHCPLLQRARRFRRSTRRQQSSRRKRLAGNRFAVEADMNAGDEPKKVPSVRTPEQSPAGRSQATIGVRGVIIRSQFEETSEAMYLASGYVYGSSAEAEQAFTGEVDRYVYSRYRNPANRQFGGSTR